jgi:hypothetical protein
MKKFLFCLWIGAACSVEDRGWLVELQGQVLDQNDRGVPGADLQVTSTANGEPLGMVSTDSDGVWSLPLFVEEGQEAQVWPMSLRATVSGYQSGQSDWSFSWLDEDWPAMPVSLGPGQFVAAGHQQSASVTVFEGDDAWTARGRTKDVLTGFAVDGVRVRLRKGWNAPVDSEVLEEQFSDANGYFSFSVQEQGIYTLETVGPPGYAASVAALRMGPESSNSQMMLTDKPDSQVVLMSPTLGSGEMRVALSWNQEQRDLDLHISGPLSGSGGRYQVYVDDTPHPVNGDPIAQVEWSSGLWESVGVYTIRSGTYRFSAFDVDNQLLVGDTSLSESGATLTLWTENGVWMERLWPGQMGTLWQGLELDVTRNLVHRLQGLDEARDAWDVSAF